MRVPLYRTGAWCWIITGVGHTAGDLALRISSPAADRDLDALLRSRPFDLLGTSTSHYDLYMGFSLAMGLAIALVGLLFLMLERFTQDPARLRSAGAVGLAASLGMLVLSVVLLPLPPIVFFTIASAAFAVLTLRSATPDAAARA
ncbi:hypothetical protein ACIBEJ_14445 [Nonomuraea sp. NPDC050790]|uniref:LIC_13387 family protein n=1 Tax=Nonomuraea sp. NPDC050790 TaxID=3364371 RepID=UPI003797D2C8